MFVVNLCNICSKAYLYFSVDFPFRVWMSWMKFILLYIRLLMRINTHAYDNVIDQYYLSITLWIGLVYDKVESHLFGSKVCLVR